LTQIDRRLRGVDCSGSKNLHTAVKRYLGVDQKALEQVGAIAARGRVRDHQKFDVAVAVVAGLMFRFGRNFQTLMRVEQVTLAFKLHTERAAQYKKELPTLGVIVTNLRCTGRHPLVDDREILPLQQCPAVALVAPEIVFGIIFRYHVDFPYPLYGTDTITILSANKYAFSIILMLTRAFHTKDKRKPAGGGFFIVKR